MGSAWDASERQWANALTAEARDRDARRLHHSADNSIHPFVDDDRQQYAIRSLAHDAELMRYDPLAVDFDSGPHPLHHALRWLLRREHQIFFREAVPWVHDPIGDFTVVGEEEEPFRVAIEATDRIESWFRRNQLHHRPPVPLIARRSNESRRLVQHDILIGLAANLPSVNPNRSANGVDSGTQFSDDLAVNRDAPRADELFGFSSGGDAAGREDALQSLALLLPSLSGGTHHHTFRSVGLKRWQFGHQLVVNKELNFAGLCLRLGRWSEDQPIAE